MKKITALSNTKLKKKPVDSSELKPEEYVIVPRNKHYFVAAEKAQENHTQVTLAYGAGTWFIFNEHWDGLINPQLMEVDENNIIDSIREAANSFGLTLKAQHAYIIATVQWETANTFKPVKEAYWLNESWRRDNLRYFPFYGRGYVQLTWEFNYLTYGSLLGLDLVDNPDLALEPNIAMYILCHGFKQGMFTGRKLEDYVRRNKTDFLNARRCINGTDKQQQIARLAHRYLAQL